ncbi:MAG: hypothetical protein K1X92_06425 [Bacteroidia bacterium]|nr:hypothetical protein [Bacteroidia bacterium]
MRVSKGTQDKLQKILESQGFIVRYEKGSFRGGYCVVHHQKTVIVNKFFPLEGIIQALTEVVKWVPITDKEAMPEELYRLAEKIKSEDTEIT